MNKEEITNLINSIYEEVQDAKNICQHRTGYSTVGEVETLKLALWTPDHLNYVDCIIHRQDTGGYYFISNYNADKQSHFYVEFYPHAFHLVQSEEDEFQKLTTIGTDEKCIPFELYEKMQYITSVMMVY